MLLLVILLIVTLVLLVTQVVSFEITALAVIATLGLTGLLEPSEALSGFSSAATLTVAAMLVLSAGLERTGVVDYVGRFLARRADGGLSGLLLWLAIPTVLFSAFMNNTAIVAMMIPVALLVSRRLQTSPSKLLIPISYLSILGGTCTLIGTSSNILIDSLYRRSGGPGFGMFEFTALGVLYVIAGGVYVVFIVPRWLPDRSSLAAMASKNGAGEFVTEVTIPENSPFIGRRPGELAAGDGALRVLQLVRNGVVMLGPLPDSEIRAGDVLLVEGSARTIHDILDQRRIVQDTATGGADQVKIRRVDLRMVEAVIAPNSRLVRRRVRDLRLDRRFGVRVVAVRRQGRPHRFDLQSLDIRSGDVLLLQGEERSLQSVQDEGDVLLIEGVEKTLTFPRKAPLAIAILAAVVTLAATGVAPLVLLAFAGVGLMLLTGCLTLPHATRALEPSVLILLAAMIPLGLAMEKAGLAEVIADGVVDFAGPHGPIFLIGAFYLLTSFLTEVLSNNAAAVLLTPICLGTASKLGMAPEPLLVALAFGASASFATPVGYQTNTMVMGPGGYKFRDYLKVGLPMNLLMAIVATLVIPLFWAP